MGNARRPSGGASRVGLAAVLSVLLVLMGGAAALGEAGGAGAACKRGGWRDLSDVNGHSFKNQGQCVRAAVHGRLGQPLNPQVTGSFTGTQFFELGGCSFVYQEFDLTYSTDSGPGSLFIQGCVDQPSSGDSFPYVGSFALTAPLGGTLTGSASGTVAGTTTGAIDLTLTVAAATGSLRGATGTVQVRGVWNFTTDVVTGTTTGQLVRT
jgi:hypothetical protein